MGVVTQSLWVSAKAKLDDEDQKLLAFDSDSDSGTGSHQNKLDMLESLRQTTQEAYDICIRKRWQIVIPGKGKKIIIRDLLSKIAHWVEVFKSVGDQAVSLGPGHASLPWAGTRFLLQIAINDFNKFDFVVQGAEKIAKMTARYRIVEHIYIENPSAAAEQLEQAVTRVYNLILKYLVEAKRYFEQRTGVRILKSGLLGQGDFQELIDKMEAEEREVDRCVTLVQTEMNNDIASNLATLSLEMEKFRSFQDMLSRKEQPTAQMSFQLDKFEDHLDNTQRRQVLNWLSSQPYLNHHTSIKSKVLDGTCQWVLQHASFSEWKGESTNSLLWLHGTQGSGKSCLASTVIEDGMKISKQNENFAHAYFYCSRNTAEPQRVNAQSILGCIARQLSSPSSDRPLATPTYALYKEMHSADGSIRSPNLIECRDLIIELTEAYSQATIVIDALDECDIEERGELVKALEYITDESTSLVKVFVTSREEGDLRLFLQTHSGIQVTWLENGSDIEKFVNFETDRLVAKNQLLAFIRMKSTKEELKALIKDDTINKANGMFRWAQLQLQSLRWIRTERDIRSAMSRIPRPLSALYEELYEKAIERTEETDRALFRNTLKWMLCAKRVLAWEDFSQAITSFVDIEVDDIDEEFILDLLSNFVICQTSKEGSRIFQFAHLSVREFLEDKPEYGTESSNAFAAEVCLLKLIGASGSPNSDRFLGELGVSAKATLTLSEIDSYRKDIHDYSLRNWNGHCALAGEENRENADLHLSRLLTHFLFDDSDPNCPLNCWVRSRQRRKMESIYGVHILKLLQNYHRSWDRAFLLSCVFGFREVLRSGQYHDLSDDVKEQCILAATVHRQYDILQYLIGETNDRLLQKHVLTTLMDNNDFEALKWFITLIEPELITESVIWDGNRADKEIFDLLLDHNKNLQITSELIEGCRSSYGAIEALLSRAPDVLITPQILTNAVRDMPLNFFKEILDKNDTSIITCDTIARAVHVESFGEEMRPKIDLLLERAGPIKVTEEAMMQAVSDNGNCDTLQMLIDRGWPVTQRVVQKAAEWGQPAAVKLLLEAGGELTPRVIAGGARNLECGAEMARLLVSLMDRPLDDDLWVQMMLKCARNTWGNPESLQALLEMKPGLRVPEQVLIAFTNNHIKGNITLDIILENNREMEITDAVMENALKELDYDETISKLLDRHGSTKISGQILLGAVQNGRFGDEMTKLLLHRNATIERPSAEVIEGVIRNRHSGYETLQMLENHFGQIDFSESDVRTAAESGSVTMLALILDRCSVTEATPPVLLKAAAKGSLEVMKHLLELDNAIVTKEILIAASGNTDCNIELLTVLWKLAPHVKVCPEMFLNAGDRILSRSTDLEFLFSRVEDSELCQDILNAMMRDTNTQNNWVHEPLLKIILQSDFDIELADELVMDAFKASRGRLLKVLLDHGMDIKLTQEMVNTAVELKDYPGLEVLVKHGGPHKLDLQVAKDMVNNPPSRWKFDEEK